MKHFKDDISGGQGGYVVSLSLNSCLKPFNLRIFAAIQQVKNGLKSTEINVKTTDDPIPGLCDCNSTLVMIFTECAFNYHTP